MKKLQIKHYARLVFVLLSIAWLFAQEQLAGQTITKTRIVLLGTGRPPPILSDQAPPPQSSLVTPLI